MINLIFMVIEICKIMKWFCFSVEGLFLYLIFASVILTAPNDISCIQWFICISFTLSYKLWTRQGTDPLRAVCLFEIVNYCHAYDRSSTTFYARF